MNTYILLLTAVALILLAIEIFVVPGFGVTGVLGIVALLAATYLTASNAGVLAAALLFVGISVLVAIAFYLFLRSPFAKTLVLDQTLKSGLEAQSRPIILKPGLLGASKTDLRPSGKGVFSIENVEKTFDVVTSGEFLEKDKEIQIVMIEGSRIVVSLKN